MSPCSEILVQITTYIFFLFFFSCPRSFGDESRVPTMCLICGQVLCSQSYCCQVEVDKKLVGAATAHSYVCGAGIGIFLRSVFHICLHECVFLSFRKNEAINYLCPSLTFDEYHHPFFIFFFPSLVFRDL